MKKIKLLCIAILISIFFSCEKTEDPIIDESIYYDNDENCDDHIDHGGVCGDVDGRILIIPGKSYTYTFNTYKRLMPVKLDWSTSTSDIQLVAGGGTASPTFKFAKKFTSGKIILKADFLVRENGVIAGDVKVILDVSKINSN